jgi:hypothetical protein
MNREDHPQRVILIHEGGIAARMPDQLGRASVRKIPC